MTTPASTCFHYRRTFPWLATLMVSLLATAGLGYDALRRPESGWAALGFAGIAVVCSIRLMTQKAFPQAFIEINHEGVRVYPQDGRYERLIRWEILRGIESINGTGRTPRELRFMLMDTPWHVVVPAGMSDPDVLGARILALRPAHIPAASAEDADARLDAAFGFRTPSDATLLVWETHPDGTARWEFEMPTAALRELRSASLRCSDWYPLPRDMRFELGGHSGRHGIPSAAHYAIGEGQSALTAVLIRDDAARRLICLLTRSMG